MIDDQAATIAFLAEPVAHGGAAVERIDTHTAVVFLAGDRALKLKRAVHFDYVDFSTPARRQACCDAEVRLNRRTAPGLYRGVLPVMRRTDGSLAIGGDGEAVDWLVEMQRFPQDALFDRLADRGALDVRWMAPLGRRVAAFHDAADVRHDAGGRAGMEWVIDGNAAGLAEFGAGIVDAGAVARLVDGSREALRRAAALLERRRLGGFVRQCHGDLHLGNIVLLDGEATIFDAIEFNDAIACGDVLYDLAFLLMDLWQRRLPAHANRVWNAYEVEEEECAGLALLPLFLSCRAAVRAKTCATAARLQPQPERAAVLRARARDYLAAADTLLVPPPPCIVAIGGVSGTGKSTLAAELAPIVGPVPGAVILRSDEFRKRMLGVPPLARLGREGYRHEISERVYADLVARATTIALAGHSVIVDAVFARPVDRAAIEEAAAEIGVPFVGLWLEAPLAALLERVARRQLDPSDADADIIRMQLLQGAGAVTWPHLDAEPAAPIVQREALAAVERRSPMLLGPEAAPPCRTGG